VLSEWLGISDAELDDLAAAGVLLQDEAAAGAPAVGS
jgi:hypothetical protein